MNYEADDLLGMVDKWKFKLHDKLKTMTPQERAAFWQEATNRARAMGLPVADETAPAKGARKRRPKAS